MNLYLDTSQKYLVIIFFKNDHIIDACVKLNPQKHSDNFIHYLQKISATNGISLLQDVKKIYTNLGPGSFIGTRTALTFIKAFLCLRVEVVIYTINSLLFQTPQFHDKDKVHKFFSILTLNRQSYAVAAYDDKNLILPIQLVDENTLSEMKKIFLAQKYFMRFDYTTVDFKQQLLYLVKNNYFVQFDHINCQLQPIHLMKPFFHLG